MKTKKQKRNSGRMSGDFFPNSLFSGILSEILPHAGSGSACLVQRMFDGLLGWYT
jgi:hypothetical protein